MRLFKRGSTWYGLFYADGVRIQQSTRCHDKKAAEAVLRQWERDAADPAYAASKNTSLSDALMLLVTRRAEDAAAGRKSLATVAFYKCKAGHLVRIFEMNNEGEYVPFPLCQLTAARVDEYISRRRGEAAGDNTISKELITLRGALKLARRAGLWSGEPDAVLPVRFAPDYKPKTRALSPAELQLLLAELTADKAARVAFMVTTSANWKETERARWQDVAADRSSVHLRGTKRASRDRMVPIVGEAFQSLFSYALANARGGPVDLFGRWSNVRRDLIDACARAGIPSCSPNDLRRTFATWLRAAGVAPHLIAPMMGHADTRMVERVYGRLSTQELAAQVSTALGKDCSAGATNSMDPGGFGGLPGPEELRNQPQTVPRDGIEPPTRGFSVPCSTD